MRALLRGAIVTAAVVTVVSSGVAWAAPPTSAPTITSGPAANSFTTLTTASFTFTHSDPSATFTCSLDGAKATACTSPVDYIGLAVKAHTFSVRATSPGKKQSKPTTRSWTIDQTAPNVPTVSQPTTPTKNTTASITFSDTSTDVQSYLCSLDGVAATACTSPKALSGLTHGFHTFAVIAVDKAGNQSTAKTVQWAVDTQVEDPFITSGPPSVGNTSATFTFDNDDPNVTYTCSMDSSTAGSFTACASPKAYTGLSAGNHTFRVKAIDAVGNVSNATAFTWKVNASPPISIGWGAGLPDAITNQTTATMAFTHSGDTTLACKLDGVTQGTCNSPESLSGLGDGPHTYTLLADEGLSTEVSFSYNWEVDTVAPDVPTITGPTGRVGSSDADVVVTPGAIEDTVTCTVDGVDTDCTTAMALTGLSDGDHNVTATSEDAAGNTSESTLDWTVDTTGPAATVTAPSGLKSPFVVTFDEDASGVDATSVLVTDEAGKTLATTMSCDDESADDTDCTNTDVRQVELLPVKSLMLGQHYRVQVNPLGSELVMDDLNNVSATSDDSVRAPVSAGESSAGATFAWRKVSDKKAKGGSYVTEHRKGARASWSFSGKSVTWYTLTGPNQGKADVFVDGVRKTTVNNYARSVKHGVARTVKGLAKGTHTIEVRVLGKKGSKHGKGTFIDIDGFKVGKKVTATPTLTKVAWQTTSNASASGGAYTVADLKAESMKLKLRGTSVTVKSARGPAFGKVGLYVDGKLKKTVDLYAKKLSFGYKVTVTGLADAVHTVTVKVMGSKSKASSGTGVVVDQVSTT